MVGLNHIRKMLIELDAKVDGLTDAGSKKLLAENKQLKSDNKKAAEEIAVLTNKKASLEKELEALKNKVKESK